MKKICFVIIISLINFSCQKNFVTPKTNSKISIENYNVEIDSFGIQNDDYALTFFSNDTLSLWGKFELNQNITLLDIDHNRIFEAKTKSYRISPLGAFEQNVLTNLNTKFWHEEKYPKIAFAILKKHSNLKELHSKSIKNESIQLKIDSIIKTINMSELFKNFDAIDPNYLNEKSLIEKYVTKTFSFYFISFSKENEFGPRFILFENNSLISVLGPCSNEKYRVYTIDGDVYLFGLSFCCGCGQVLFTIHQINKNDIKLVYANSDYSD
jgi:hypothetical protein